MPWKIPAKCPHSCNTSCAVLLLSRSSTSAKVSWRRTRTLWMKNRSMSWRPARWGAQIVYTAGQRQIMPRRYKYINHPYPDPERNCGIWSQWKNRLLFSDHLRAQGSSAPHWWCEDHAEIYRQWGLGFVYNWQQIRQQTNLNTCIHCKPGSSAKHDPQRKSDFSQQLVTSFVKLWLQRVFKITHKTTSFVWW